MARIAITLGDPAGIGPDVIEAALARPEVRALAEFEILGTRDSFESGSPTEAGARAAFQALEESVSRALAGEFDAVVTGPVSKKQMHAVGFDFPGQTEFFAARTGTENFAMCLTGGALTVALVTAHVPLKDVPGLLSEAEIVRVGRLLSDFLHRRGIVSPRIAAAGLNPHAGESGDLGREEIELITPAIEKLQALEPRTLFAGPLPPDTVFFRSVAGEFDGVLCMYHDQGLIPLKLHAFDAGVNVTLGLPFPRTSPDHGTAFEIAGKGIARPDSLIAAIRLAAELAR
jgi:4-hydroxythreonine-4-phosphate dehydrogenase